MFHFYLKFQKTVGNFKINNNAGYILFACYYLKIYINDVYMSMHSMNEQQQQKILYETNKINCRDFINFLPSFYSFDVDPYLHPPRNYLYNFFFLLFCVACGFDLVIIFCWGRA